MKKSKKIIFIVLLVCLLLSGTALIVAEGAYFVRGKFKDVFINKQDYFSADKLYSISTVDSNKERIACGVSEQNIFVYNHDVRTGDYNAFDVTYDVYVWLESTLPEDKQYTFILNENGAEKSISVTTIDHTSPVTSKTLKGGKCSTDSFTIRFGYEEGEDISGAPGLNVVAVPTYPVRLSGIVIGATFTPTEADTCSVSGTFEKTSNVEDYSAFTYRVQSFGPTISEGKVALKWNSDVLTLMTVNQSIIFSGVENISEGSFNKKYTWQAQNNNTDTFAFFRNNASGTWESEVTWENLEAFVSVEYVKGAE
ncbi:MAG: hypothetical protein ACI4MS_04625 [Candidatus Coproplasma sp.]